MLNIRGLDPSARSSQCWKVPYLENLVHQSIESYFFISITETWLIPAITKAQMEIHGYELFRSDRCDRERGGSCLYGRVHGIHRYFVSFLSILKFVRKGRNPDYFMRRFFSENFLNIHIYSEGKYGRSSLCVLRDIAYFFRAEFGIPCVQLLRDTKVSM